MSAILELASQAAWAEHGVAAREFVALGFVAEDGVASLGTPSVVWYTLPNSADVGEFLVDGADLQAVMQQAIVDLGEAVVQTADRVLWHSHYLAVEPSKADIDEFPGWLVNSGLVYHAPTQTTTAYSASSIALRSPASAVLGTPTHG